MKESRKLLLTYCGELLGVILAEILADNKHESSAVIRSFQAPVTRARKEQHPG